MSKLSRWFSAVAAVLLMVIFLPGKNVSALGLNGIKLGPVQFYGKDLREHQTVDLTEYGGSGTLSWDPAGVITLDHAQLNNYSISVYGDANYTAVVKLRGENIIKCRNPDAFYAETDLKVQAEQDASLTVFKEEGGCVFYARDGSLTLDGGRYDLHLQGSNIFAKKEITIQNSAEISITNTGDEGSYIIASTKPLNILDGTTLIVQQTEGESVCGISGTSVLIDHSKFVYEAGSGYGNSISARDFEKAIILTNSEIIMNQAGKIHAGGDLLISGCKIQMENQGKAIKVQRNLHVIDTSLQMDSRYDYPVSVENNLILDGNTCIEWKSAYPVSVRNQAFIHGEKIELTSKMAVLDAQNGVWIDADRLHTGMITTGNGDIRLEGNSEVIGFGKPVLAAQNGKIYMNGMGFCTPNMSSETPAVVASTEKAGQGPGIILSENSKPGYIAVTTEYPAQEYSNLKYVTKLMPVEQTSEIPEYFSWEAPPKVFAVAEHGEVIFHETKFLPGRVIHFTVKPEKGYFMEKLRIIGKNSGEILFKDLKNGEFSFRMPREGAAVRPEFQLEPIEEPTPEITVGWITDKYGNWSYGASDESWSATGWEYLPYRGRTEWYLFNAFGRMETGWMKSGKEWYYLNPVSDGTRGRMMTDWQKIDGNWYYFNPVSDGTRGKMMTGWQYINGKWYYLNPISDGTRGKLLVNTITPDGYYVDYSGARIS